MIGVRFLALVASAVFLTLVVACADQPKVMNIPLAPVRASKDLVTDQDVKEAITRAATSLGWSTREVSPRTLIATKTEEDRVAVVNIDYQMSAYSIRYQDSHNLKYKARPTSDMAGTIHDFGYATIDKKYNEWVQSLDQAIQHQLADLR
jgi:hypothetical protein